MAGLAETEEFPAEIYQIETTDPVVGGAPNEGTGAGMSNIPHLQLAKRTRWLKAQVDALVDAVVDATTAVKGIVLLSTSTNSTSTTTAATPSAVKAVNDNANTRALKTTIFATAGLASGGGDLSANRTITVPKASQAEAEAGTDDTKAMTPLATAQAVAAAMDVVGVATEDFVHLTVQSGVSTMLGSQSGAAPVYAARAWVNFNGTGTPMIRAAGNVSSITDNDIGDYTVNFSTPMQDANYACISVPSKPGSSAWVYWAQPRSVADITATSVRIQTGYVSGTDSGNYNARTDLEAVSVSIFR